MAVTSGHRQVKSHVVGENCPGRLAGWMPVFRWSNPTVGLCIYIFQRWLNLYPELLDFINPLKKKN